jgi:D-lactate dehydrogenase
MNIVFFELEDVETRVMLDLYGDVDYDAVKGSLNADNAGKYADAEIISCFVYSDLSRDVLRKLKRLKFITTRSRTVDHIDLEYCRQHGITVANVPGYGIDTVAEHVFALLLCLSRRLLQAAQRTREGNFSLEGLQGSELHGKTFGIIGTGSIGLHVAKIAKAFGMNVIAYDPFPRAKEAAAIGFDYISFDKLISQADIISLHISNTPEVSHLLSVKEFSAMKKDVVIINTSIGSALDVKALLEALATGKVGAVGLDVLPDEAGIREEAEFMKDSFSVHHDAETLLATQKLLHHKNVIVTPHIAFYTKETVKNILHITHDNIQSFQLGQSLNAVHELSSPVAARTPG